ncbi:MAG: hypothetical protein IV092_10505 [Burkholderiaceae bacterium]|nr:hypothetical protein [Burkholderiaceae bacterium]
MRLRYWAIAVVGCLTAGLAQAADCKPSPLGARELFLRGSMNGWAARDDYAFQYRCDAYYLNVTVGGRQEFKVADADWSLDASIGLGDDGQPALGARANLQQQFDGEQTVTLAFVDGRPRLSLGPRSFVAAPPKAVTDPVALSLRFDSRAPQHKKPFGAVPAGTELQFMLSALPGVTRATLVLENRRLVGNQEQLDYAPLARIAMQPRTLGRWVQWQARHRFTQPAVYGYHFELEIAGQSYVFQNNRDEIYWTREAGSMGLGLVAEKPADAKRIRRYRQTVHAADFKVPGWARDLVYYYVFPERFRNGDRTNDPQPARDRYQNQGIELHANWTDRPNKPGDGSDAVYNNDFYGGDLAGLIDKLDYIKGLGANAIYLTPIFKAASNHKYDTADYRQVDPAFGTNADFERLCAEAAKRGMRVIPDTSLNHVGSDSPYFNRYGNYPAGGAFDKGRLNPASAYASWFKLDASQAKPEDQYQGWTGVKDLPELDKSSRAFRAFAYGNSDSVMKLWLNRGAAGWRMDVAPWVADDFWREWRAAIKAHKPDALTVAETWFDASKFLLGDMFDSTMNYIFRNAVLDYAAGGDARKLYANIELMREAYPPQAFYALMNLLSTHDQPRALHHFGYLDDGNAAKLSEAKQRLRLALLFQMTFPGSPTIYYGDEVGVGGGDDPYNRAPYPWADQGGQPDEALLADFKRLSGLRQQLKVLRHGTISAPLHLDQHLIVLARQDGKRWALTATNNDTRPRSTTLTLPTALASAEFVDALSGERFKARSGQLTLTLPALFGRVLIWN